MKAAVFRAELPAGETRIADVQALAATLASEGRIEDSVLLLEHLAAIQPGDAETLRPLAKLLGAQGRVLESIAALTALKASTTDMESILDDIQTQIVPAVECFNRHLTAGEVEQAERYASALADLVPRNAALQNAALSCNLALGRKEKAAKYAAILHTLDPAHPAASSLLAEGTKETGPEGELIEDRLATVLSPSGGQHPLLRLRDLHDAMSAILCRPLDDLSAGRIEKILAAAHELSVPVAAGSEWAAWEKHYRVMLDAADMPFMLGATPELLPETGAELMSSSGAPITWEKLQADTERMGARCVFFAAADLHYVDLYARWYVKSILKHCDVPFVAVVHVIGGAGQLGKIVKSVGVRDKRVFFTADDFDASAVTTKCYDSPPKGMIEKPVAHFQSARFLRLGSLLHCLKRPTFVSDIDLLLQRGVSDLIERCSGEDVVFNENSASVHAGSRLTANLLLVNPTANAGLFLRFLRAYLEHMLKKPEVSRWIDQFALLLARHHLSLKAKDPRIAYFDTNTDINNVMYPSYRDNPFRFLSLYHGFDLSSLEGSSQTAVEEPQRAKARRKRLA